MEMEVFGSLGAKIGADGRVIGVFQFVDFAIMRKIRAIETLQADFGDTG